MSNKTFPKMHVSIYVSDLTSTVNFYTSFFEQPAVKVEKGYAKYILDQPALIISFIENPERVQSNFGHLGFQVETSEEMQLRLLSAKKKGIVSKEEMGTACCYAIQDKFWVNDPDGVQWEVYYFHEDVAFNDPHFESEGAEACCMPPAEAKLKIKLSELQEQGQACEPGSGCC